MKNIIVKNIHKLFNRLGYKIEKIGNRLSLGALSISHIAHLLEHVTYFQDKMDIINCFDFNPQNGIYSLKEDLSITSKEKFKAILSKYNLFNYDFSCTDNSITTDTHNHTSLELLNKIHYACGNKLFTDWLNIDFCPRKGDNYLRLNLTEKHPFQNDSFQFGFSEDFLEHLNQDDSIIFLAEVYRTLKKGGVLRLSFPGLEGVLLKHYNNTPSTEFTAKVEAYLYWDHVHFYSKGELIIIAKHLGFTNIEFVEYGVSKYQELCNLDSREKQVGLNTYVELRK